MVGGAIIILKNMSSSMGRMIPIYYGKINNVPKHQPVILMAPIRIIPIYYGKIEEVPKHQPVICKKNI